MDIHLQLDYAPDRASDGNNSEELMLRHFERARRNNFEFSRVERLAGNIGYLLLRARLQKLARTLFSGFSKLFRDLLRTYTS